MKETAMTQLLLKGVSPTWQGRNCFIIPQHNVFKNKTQMQWLIDRLINWFIDLAHSYS